mmetsp:Transcript_7894/g.20226  ORF Transcript_7894/g.20226 Transcript_7894/m.20226 type:complete len:104 (-) Transcript_7894:511-822(-)|eukprot:CAMPEP_0119415762 /NCGR_PEP_ID=MMETSP1335-20130426/10445_1 /TAXON_ID=259385 /ORGANISM="Chrysoculter rhomboideus, Strain RCC1486" /LENGTH=103 /DNA_ID=CAMNT_0007440803 /DNA_START=88 /DNA_END=399 /DNA_ORIENTATION=-
MDPTKLNIRKDVRPYRDGCSRLKALSLSNIDMTATPPPVPKSAPLDLQAGPIFTIRDRPVVKSWQGFEALAVTHGWAPPSVEAPRKQAMPKDGALLVRAHAGG